MLPVATIKKVDRLPCLSSSTHLFQRALAAPPVAPRKGPRRNHSHSLAPTKAGPSILCVGTKVGACLQEVSLHGSSFELCDRQLRPLLHAQLRKLQLTDCRSGVIYVAFVPVVNQLTLHWSDVWIGGLGI